MAKFIKLQTFIEDEYYEYKDSILGSQNTIDVEDDEYIETYYIPSNTMYINVDHIVCFYLNNSDLPNFECIEPFTLIELDSYTEYEGNEIIIVNLSPDKLHDLITK